MVDLVQAGRDPVDLAREFEPSAESIRAWVPRATGKEGCPVSFADISPWDRGAMEEKSDGLRATERDELTKLRRENKQQRVERDILSRAAGWFARDNS